MKSNMTIALVNLKCSGEKKFILLKEEKAKSNPLFALLAIGHFSIYLLSGLGAYVLHSLSTGGLFSVMGPSKTGRRKNKFAFKIKKYTYSLLTFNRLYTN